MDDAGHREQARQLLRRVRLDCEDATGPPQFSKVRRELLGAFGWAALASLASGTMPAAAASSTSGSAEGDVLEVVVDRLGPQLVAAGAIDPSRFAQACASAGAPLDVDRLRILGTGSDRPIAFDASSAHFLLNLFWAVGLANANPILTRGPMVQNGFSRIAGYASTGGWTLTKRPVMAIYARTPLVSLTTQQQERLEEVTSNVFRPCCDNPANFPDCNHGMAMLGLLTRLAADDRDVQALFAAAKAANRHWFPQQSAQLAQFVQASRGIDYTLLDGREAGSRELFAASGFARVTAWLREHGLGAPANGSSCAA